MFLTYHWQQICLLRKLNNAHNYQFPPLSSRLWLSYLGIAILELSTRSVNYNLGFCDTIMICWHYHLFSIIKTIKLFWYISIDYQNSFIIKKYKIVLSAWRQTKKISVNSTKFILFRCKYFDLEFMSLIVVSSRLNLTLIEKIIYESKLGVKHYTKYIFFVTILLRPMILHKKKNSLYQ